MSYVNASIGSRSYLQTASLAVTHQNAHMWSHTTRAYESVDVTVFHISHLQKRSQMKHGTTSRLCALVIIIYACVIIYTV